jgi:hypothetical protein
VVTMPAGPGHIHIVIVARTNHIEISPTVCADDSRDFRLEGPCFFRRRYRSKPTLLGKGERGRVLLEPGRVCPKLTVLHLRRK